MPSLQSRMCAYFFRSEAPSLHITFVFHPPPRGRQSLKSWLEPPGPTSPVIPFYFLVHPEWKKSRSTPQPFTLFRSRWAYCTACVVSTFVICFHEPVFPATGYGGIKKATAWRVGRVLFAVIRCSARRGGKRGQILKRNGNHRWE
jgi:hypothetical protein